MTSAKAKGAGYEREAVKILEGMGYVVERALPKLVYIAKMRRTISLAHDFFGAWDLIGVKLNARTLFVQVTTLENVSHKLDKALAFPWDRMMHQVEVWGRVKGRNAHFRVFSRDVNFQWQGETRMVGQYPLPEPSAPIVIHEPNGGTAE